MQTDMYTRGNDMCVCRKALKGSSVMIFYMNFASEGRGVDNTM